MASSSVCVSNVSIYEGGRKTFCSSSTKNVYIVHTQTHTHTQKYVHRFSHSHWFCLNLRLISKIFNWHTHTNTHNVCFFIIFLQIRAVTNLYLIETRTHTSNHIWFSFGRYCTTLDMSSTFNINKYCSYNDDDLGGGDGKSFVLEGGW